VNSSAGRPPRERVDLAEDELRRSLSAGQLRRDADTLATYGRDDSDAGEFPADLVVFAESTRDVALVLRICQRLGVPVTPVAARTGKSGGSLPIHGGVSLSLERMNRILSVSQEDLTAVCQAGVITGDLMRAAEEKGLFYPPDPNSWETCTLGGNVAENAGGPRALKYGVTADYVIGLEWVMPTGEVLRVGRRTLKGVAGYDLVRLFVGSEGTLGIATEITVQLLPLPRAVRTALVLFRSVADAARAITRVLTSGILPRTLELLDEVAVRAVDGRGFSFPAGTGAAVIAEVDGDDPEPLLAQLARLAEICERAGATDTLVAADASQRDRLWSARRSISPALRALAPHKLSEDIVVPLSKVPEVIAQLKAMGEQLGLTVATYGHAGDGNLHANVLFEGAHQRAAVEEAIARMMRIAVEAGGTITGEHGVGLSKREFLGLEQSPEVLALQRRIKALFDPRGLLNPGKIFPG
jgi:glycolate oxidase